MSVPRQPQKVNQFSIISVKPLFIVMDNGTGRSWNTTASDCSCRDLYPHDRPADLPACEHMRAVSVWQELQIEIAEDLDDHEGWTTMKGPL